MMLNRKQFRQHWTAINPELAVEDGPLWMMETYADHRPSRWFVQIRQRQWKSFEDKNQYWAWCHQHCAGQVMCYTVDSDQNQEWWGFTHQADIVLWLLKWA